MTTYTNPFTGQTISPSSVSYESLTISSNTTLQWPINGNDSTPASSIIDVTATVGSLTLALPPATQVSTGQTVLVRNIGSNTFTVTGYTGTTVVAVSSGVAQFIFLTNNSTEAGVWSTVVLGAGTSSANAAALAGAGLTPIGTTLNQAYTTASYFSNATLPSSVRAQLVVWSSGVGTLTLPSASSVGANWFCMIRNGGTGILTLTPSGTDTIDGNVNQQLQLTESLVLVSDGSNWNTFGYGRSNSFAYTQLSLSVTGGTTVLTASQAANTIQYYSGALTSNQIIQVPSTVQFYIISNYTTGAYTFTVKTVTGGALTVTIGQSSTLTVYCDGTNVFNASSGATGGGGSSTFTTVTLGNGSTSVPSLKFAGDLNSGLYLPSSGQVGIVVTNAQAGYFDSTGLTIVGKVAASGVVSGTLGTFSGAVSGTTGTFSSVVSGTLGTFSGAVSGTTGTFSGAVSGTTGTFTGAVSGTTGTFTTGITGGTF
jgi:hypothetical protein